MHRFITLLAALSIMTANAQESVSADSLSKSVSYPKLILPAGDMGSVVQSYRFEEAKANYEAAITQLKRKRKDTAQQEMQIELCDKFIKGLQGTDRIVVFDSLVVDKDKFLTGYEYMNDLGTITLSPDGKSTTFTSELGNKMYESVSVMTDDGEVSSTFKCYYIENGVKLSSTILDGLEVDGELNYPFLMSDGVTFYFAARTDEGYGNYDIYVTRYDSDDDRFYRAENLGFPFNSYANDYMMVIDEINEVGWFASDRFQPEGKVCIYSFLYSPSRHPYDYESDDHSEIIATASLRSIRSTWEPDNEQARIKARQRLVLSNGADSNKRNVDFEFIINENFTYEHLSDFQSPEAREKFELWQKQVKEYDNRKKQLASMRERYNQAGDLGRESMREEILALESSVEQLQKDNHTLEKLIRQLEAQK